MNELPKFRGTKPSVENYCAKCGTDSTAGCWRRGWQVGEDSVNLCNRCGLQYKNGKLDKIIEPAKVSDDSLPPEGMNDSGKPYLCHSMERVSLEGVSKKVLFYVHDADGNEKLAGIDVRGTGHFTYESVEGFEPSLKCKNRGVVLGWLRDMGAGKAIERNGGDGSIGGRKSATGTRAPPRPSFDNHYVDYRSKTGIEGDTTFEKLFLVDKEGSECLAVCGTGQVNNSFEESDKKYRCILQNHDLVFDDRAEAIGWLKWIVGKVDLPPQRFLKKEPRKPVRTRDIFASSLQENLPKRRMSSVMIEDMHAIFEDQDLINWVLRQPSGEEVANFHEWRRQLTIETSRPYEGASSDQEYNQLLGLLNRLKKSETCLKLLETSSIGRPISALRGHPNQVVAGVANEIANAWKDLTARALAKASEARRKKETA